MTWILILLAMLAIAYLVKVAWNIFNWWYMHADVSRLTLGIAFLGYRNNLHRLRNKR